MKHIIKASRLAALILVGISSAANSHAQLPTITNQPANRALWAGGNVSFAAGVSNAGAFTYQWQLNGTNLPNDIIMTVAGSRTQGYAGDGGAATSAELQTPSSVAMDAAGNLFIADQSNNRIRKVDTNGVITTVAGNGAGTPYQGTYSGDNGAATNAGLNQPYGVCLDATGNIFIADTGNNRVRKVDTNGIITSVTSSLSSPRGVWVNGPANLFIADYGNNVVRKINTNGISTIVAGGGGHYPGDGAAATQARLNYPGGVITDVTGNLFISDNQDFRIRKVGTNGIIMTAAGDGTNGFSGDGGLATNATLSYPCGVAMDNSGNLYIADNANNRVRKVDPSGTITTFAGNGTNSGVFTNGQYLVGDGGAATNANMDNPNGVAADAAGNVFIADYYHNRVRKVTNTQGPRLALNAVSSENAGSYQLVVTGPGGSVTSSVVNLVVATTPLIYQTASNPDGSVALYFVSQPNTTNVVLGATNLLPPIAWQSVSTNFAGPDGNWQFTDTNAASYQTRFYWSITQ